MNVFIEMLKEKLVWDSVLKIKIYILTLLFWWMSNKYLSVKNFRWDNSSNYK